MDYNYYQLYQFTLAEVKDARSAARQGRKDSARNTLRYVRNARIIEVLKPHHGSGVVPIDAAFLEWQLKELETECHPSHQADDRDDLVAIRGLLEVIAGGINTLIQKDAT